MKEVRLPRFPRLAFRRLLASAAAAGAGLLVSTEVSAQVHADASAQVGVSKHFLTSAYSQPTFGPTATVAAHVALIPLLRLGAYAMADLVPVDSEPVRRYYGAGLRAKLQAPWLFGRVHMWGFAGIGYVGVYGPSESRTLSVQRVGDLQGEPTGPTQFSVGGSGGHYLEVPFGVGLGVRLRKPWELVFELGGRVGFGFAGSLYDGRDAVSPTASPEVVAPVGNDTISTFLTVGIGLDL